MFYREHKINIILWSVFCSWQWNIHYSCFWPFCPEGGERGGLGGWVGTKEPADCNIGVQIIAGTLSRISKVCTLTKVFHCQRFSFGNFYGIRRVGSKCDLWYYEDILVSLKQQSFFLALINLSPQATPGNWKETEMCDVGIFSTHLTILSFPQKFQGILGKFLSCLRSICLCISLLGCLITFLMLE